MAITRTAKKLVQSALSNAVTAKYTTPASTTTQVTEIWFANTNTTTARKVKLLAHGLVDPGNVLIPEIMIAAKGVEIIDGSKIALATTEVLAASQDAGTDVIMTAYGVEEVTS